MATGLTPDWPEIRTPTGVLTSPLVERIRQGIIGEGELMDGPFGPRRVTYADDTASGRSLDFLEDFIREQVLPRYANTHNESSGTGLATTRLREDARRIIRDAAGGTADDLVIFCGSGATAAVNKLIGILELRIPAGLDERYEFSRSIPEAERPVVFVGPYEHHSNELPWRESIAEVVVIGEDAGGHIDVADLDRQLRAHADRPLLIGSFSAASNVTGILTDADAVAVLLHAHGALSFWDYAAAGPYLPIRVSASPPGAGDHKDAVFLSPHKFPGGPQTPGVLVVRRDLVRNSVPTVPGGGTVAFVDPIGHRYLDDPVAREEGGTPAIVESIRAGLVFALKQAVGTGLIAAREQQLWRHVLRRWAGSPGVEVLGNQQAARLSIVSFRIRYGPRYLHHNFVVALLNDLFGIQARGGCSCAGPYGHRLLAGHHARGRRALVPADDDRRPRLHRVGAVVPRQARRRRDARRDPRLHRRHARQLPVPVPGPRPRRERNGRHLHRPVRTGRGPCGPVRQIAGGGPAFDAREGVRCHGRNDGHSGFLGRLVEPAGRCAGDHGPGRDGLGPGPEQAAPRQPAPDSLRHLPRLQEARDALRLRYARGEISREDYLQGKVELED